MDKKTKTKFLAFTMAYLAMVGVGVAQIPRSEVSAASSPKISKIELSGGTTIDTGKTATKTFTATITMTKEKILTGPQRVSKCNGLTWTSSDKKVATVKANKDGKASGSYKATCTAVITAVKGAGDNAVSKITAKSGSKSGTRNIHLALNTATAPTVTGLVSGQTYYSNTTGTFKSNLLSGTNYYIAKKITTKGKCPKNFQKPTTKWANAKRADSFKVSAANGYCSKYWIIVRSKDNYTSNFGNTKTLKVTVDKIVSAPTISNIGVDINKAAITATITPSTTNGNAVTYYTVDGSNPSLKTNTSRKAITKASVISVPATDGNNVTYTIKAATVRGGGTSNVVSSSAKASYHAESTTPESGSSTITVDPSTQTRSETPAQGDEETNPGEAQDETEVGDDETQALDDVSSSIEEGTYDKEIVVKLGEDMDGVKIYYTLDGTNPTTSSTVYTADGIKLTPPETGSKTYTIKALAVDENGNSGITTYEYTLKAPDTDDKEGNSADEEEEEEEEATTATTTSGNKTIGAPKTGFASEGQANGFDFGVFCIVASVMLFLVASVLVAKKVESNRSIRL